MPPGITFKFQGMDKKYEQQSGMDGGVAVQQAKVQTSRSCFAYLLTMCVACSR
jgi:hypothetical protein